MTGTVCEEALLSEPQPGGQGRPRHLLTLAAATDDELRRRATALADSAAGLPPAELCALAAQGDRQGEHRLAVSGPGAAELVAGLNAFAAGQKGSGVTVGRVTTPRPRTLRAAWAAGCRVFIELGPNPVLAGMARPLVAAEAAFLPMLRRRRGDWQVALDAAAELWVRGFDVSTGARTA